MLLGEEAEGGASDLGRGEGGVFGGLDGADADASEDEPRGQGKQSWVSRVSPAYEPLVRADPPAATEREHHPQRARPDFGVCRSPAGPAYGRLLRASRW